MVLGIPLGSMFLDAEKLYSLLALVPLILLYLVRPRPKEKTIPSVMFFLRDMGAANSRSFFRRFTRDWLFWIQLFTLLLLALAIAKPFIMRPETSLAEHTVIILDVSASMMTLKDGKPRFEEAKERALESLGKKNTIILAKNIPRVVKQQVDKDEAKNYLEALEVTSSSTAIYDATRTALDYAGEGTRIVVLSDFIETEVDSNINSVKRALMARGAVVEFVSYSSPVNNIGIIDMIVKDETTTVQVKNYYPSTQDVVIRIGNIEETLTIESGGSEIFTFTTPSGVNTVELDVNDDFALDNKAFISTPQDTEVKVLVITNDDNIEKSNIWIALKAIKEKTHYELTIEKAVPPKSIKVEHDLIIIKDFDASKILPGVFRDIDKRVREHGAAAIIMAQRGLFAFDAADRILPVEFVEEVKTGGDIYKPQPEIKILTEEVNFGHVDYYFSTKPKKNVRTIASVNNGTIIAFESRGAGRILYYGIFDDDIKVDGKIKTSTFKHDLFYPIFWKRTVDIITNSLGIKLLNMRTGRVLNLGKEKIKTPDGALAEGTFVLDRQGVYDFKGKKIAVNLLHSKESDVSGEFSATEFEEVETELVERDKPKELTTYFIVLGLLFLLLELLYTKMRGDM